MSFARKDMADFLTLMTQTDADEITVVAHSMGSYLLMEALRTLSLQGKTGVISHMDNMLLAAPDIDIDVFKKQLADIKKLPKKTIVQVSSKDRILKLSRGITGGPVRLGEGSDIDFLRRHGIFVLDMSQVDGGGHTIMFSSPTMISLAKKSYLVHSGLEDDFLIAPKGVSLSFIQKLVLPIVYAPIHFISAFVKSRHPAM
ncbi:hypothetical protein B488_07640 [Liberibacter crescens BT-1]|uniref:Uncharacterized protein n=2 Tax=Liberibacter crescens TaxID=1273132 RepID=L0EWJ8_LIBCB|nr:hypothetical protein B488_07640 [Liberibacter crescens BT-1]